MLSKTIVAALLATAAVALPAKVARDTTTTPDWILHPESIDSHDRPSEPVKRDPNSLVHFYIPGAPAPDAEEETADLDKRFYIYHRPPPPVSAPAEKRDIEPEWILHPQSIDSHNRPSAPIKRDSEEEPADLDKRFYIYHRPPPPGPEPLGEESDDATEKRA